MKYTLRKDRSEEERSALREQDRKYYHEKRKHTASYIKQKQDWYFKNRKEQGLRNKLCKFKREYGITFEDYENLLKEQNNVCAICAKNESGRMLSVDHDHETGEVRGLLCGSCNRALGLFKDDPSLLKRAEEYVS